MLLEKPWENVTHVDLDRIKGFQEGTCLDFKRELPKKSQPDPANPKASKTDEWLGTCKLLASFANTKGGVVVFGIEEKNGVATAIKGVKIENWERLRQKITQKLRKNIDPTLSDPLLFKITLPSGKSVVIMVIEPSSRAPHSVQTGNSATFYKRVEAGVVSMNRTEIQEAFQGKKCVPEKAESIRTERIKLSLSDNGGRFALNPPVFFFHLIPFEMRANADILQLENNEIRRDFVDSVAAFEKYNGGRLFYSQENLCHEGLFFKEEFPDKRTCYLLIQRDGIIEFAGSCHNPQSGAFDQLVWEKLGSDCFAHLLPTLSKCGISPPWFLCYSLSGVRDLKLQLKYPPDMIAEFISSKGLSHDEYLPPVVQVDSLPPIDKKEFPEYVREHFQPSFNRIWNDIDVRSSPKSPFIEGGALRYYFHN